MNNATSLVGDVDLTLPWFLADPSKGPDAYKNGPWVLLDLETTNLDKGDALNKQNDIVCAAWVTSLDPAIQFKRGNEYEQEELLTAINSILDMGGFIIAQNVKFELHWLSRMGLDLYKAVVYDTMLGEYAIGGNRWAMAHLSLDKLNKKYGGTGKMKIVDALIKGGVCPSDISPELIQARVTKDVADTHLVFVKQRQSLIERDQLPVAWTRNLVTPCLTWIEQRGIKLDEARTYEEYERAFAAMAQLNQEMDAFTGGINWKSTKQKAQFLYGKRSHEEDVLKVHNGLGFSEVKRAKRGKPSGDWVNGVPKTDDKTLAKLKATTKRQRRFLEMLRTATKLSAQLSKTLDFFKGVVDEYDGQFHGVFNQVTTATHRLSSSGRRLLMQQFTDSQGRAKGKSAQFQNLPRQFKDCLRPKEAGWLMGEVDGSQLEFRVAAYLGRDPVAISDIRNDTDIHLFTASVLNGVGVEDVTKPMRQAAKADTFKPLYGGQSGTVKQVEYYKAFRAKYSALYKEQTSWTHTVLNSKYLRTEWGMEYHFANTRMSQDGYIDNTASIFNYPVQTLATAEIVPVALVYLWHRLLVNDAKTTIVNTVHDSAIAEVAPGEERLWGRLSVQTFTLDVYEYLDRVYDLQFNVPLGVGISLGERWTSEDTVECELNVEPDGDVWFKGERADANDSKNRNAWNRMMGWSNA